MTRYLLDTNHLSPLVTVGHPLRVRVLTQLGMGDEFAVPVPALAELLYGVHLTPRVAQNGSVFAIASDTIPSIDQRRNLRQNCRRRYDAAVDNLPPSMP